MLNKSHLGLLLVFPLSPATETRLMQTGLGSNPHIFAGSSVIPCHQVSAFATLFSHLLPPSLAQVPGFLIPFEVCSTKSKQSRTNRQPTLNVRMEWNPELPSSQVTMAVDRSYGECAKGHMPSPMQGRGSAHSLGERALCGD